MDLFLTKDDYEIVEKKNFYGFTHRLPQLKDGKILNYVSDPVHKSVVLMKKDDNLVPVLILDGQYEVDGRLSNVWEWQEINEDLTLGKKDGGYGGFYECHIPIEVKIEIKLSL